MSDSTGVLVVDTVVVWAAATAAITAGLALLWAMVRGIRRIVARVDEIVDDWQGIPGRPGVEGRPGVMERLSGIEQRLSGVEHELHPNSGHSLRDAIDRVDRRTGQLADDQEQTE
ncbi:MULTISPECIES: hypothetical protein [Streptomyces]|uniref:Secreted protein n=1 Tax=Streptomyces flavovirens TaxID=52258 RepID=A0ABV8NE58_9ACTN|nr:hypothetical protein [Streptomyces sp. MBT51]MBK3592424.1 hypothetical protein [Streptomyces sp. MBT51]